MARAAESRTPASKLRADFPLGERTGYLLHKASMVLEEDFERALAAVDMKARDFFVLAALAGDTPLSQQDLSRLLGLDPTTVVSVIDDLERRRCVARKRNPADRRRYILTLTATGRRALAKGERVAADVEAAFLAELDRTEQARLRQALSKIMAERWPAAVVSS